MSFKEGVTRLGWSFSHLEVLCFLSVSLDLDKDIKQTLMGGRWLSETVLESAWIYSRKRQVLAIGPIL